MSRKVTVIYRFLPQYRVDFFDRLRERLEQNGTKFTLVYGKNGESSKKDERDLTWADPIKNRKFRIAGRELYWQPIAPEMLNTDLLILMQETKILSNFSLLARARKKRIRTAFWGHGLNFQANPKSIGNRIKSLYSNRVDWWFAYTDKVAGMVERMGFPKERISVVQNAIDTERLMKSAEEWTPEKVRAFREQLGLEPGPVGIYCGAMYAEKRIDFLLRACLEIRTSIPKFQAIFVGAGPDSGMVKQFAAEHSWAHYFGPRFDLERIPFFKIADVSMMPGAVGLGILDSFAMGTVMVTTRDPFHGPEIDYLEDGVNGIMTDDSLEAFTEGAKKLLSDTEQRQSLRRRSLESARRYTLLAMVDSFATGIKGALSAPVRN